MSHRLHGRTGAAMAIAPSQCEAELRGIAGRALLSSVSASDAPASAAMGEPPPPPVAAAHWQGQHASWILPLGHCYEAGGMSETQTANVSLIVRSAQINHIEQMEILSAQRQIHVRHNS